MGFLDDLASKDPAPAPPVSSPDITGRSNLDASKPTGFLESLDEADQANKTAQEPVPDWSSIPAKAAINAPHSAMEFGKNLAQPFLHPIKTAESVGNIGLGVMEKLGLYGSSSHEKYADAIGQMLVDRYGNIDNVKKTLAHDPVGVLADISAIGTGGGSILSQAPGIVGKVGEAANTIGRIADPLNVVTAPLKGAGVLAKEGFGLRSGAGPEAVETAARAGYEGGEAAKIQRENIRQHVPIEKVVQDANDAMDNIIKGKNATYQQAMAQAGLTKPISTSGFQKIADGMQAAESIAAKTPPLGGFTPAVVKANEDLRAIVEDFVYNQQHRHTIEGLDALKQTIGEYQREHIDGGKAVIVGNEYYNAVKGAITSQAPKYAKIMEDYGEAKDLLSQLQKTFSLPADQRKLNVDTALRKLQSVMRNNVNTNYGFRKTLLENLENNGAPHLRNALSGQALNSTAPRGLARISIEAGAEAATGLLGLFTGHPGALAAALAAMGITAMTSSPRIVGESAYYAGRMASPLKYAPINKPLARAYQQVGRASTLPDMQARGGAVERALRTTNRRLP